MIPVFLQLVCHLHGGEALRAAVFQELIRATLMSEPEEMSWVICLLPTTQGNLSAGEARTHLGGTGSLDSFLQSSGSSNPTRSLKLLQKPWIHSGALVLNLIYFSFRYYIPQGQKTHSMGFPNFSIHYYIYSANIGLLSIISFSIYSSTENTVNNRAKFLWSWSLYPRRRS